MLEVENLSKRFGGLAAVSDVSFGVKRGEIVSLIGPNGAGKTTCLNLITGFYKPTAGRVTYDGKDITGWKDLVTTVKAKHLKFTLLDDMREVLGVGLMLNGHSVNSVKPEELQQAADTIIDMKPYVAAFTYDSRPMVESGDIAAAHFFVGSMINVFGNPKDLGYVIPEEGATMYQEDMCVLKTAPNKANAIKFQQFYTRPDIAALNVSQQTNGTPNVPARQLTPENIKNSKEINPTDDTMKRLQIFENLGPGLRQFDRAWTKVKTAQ